MEKSIKTRAERDLRANPGGGYSKTGKKSV